MIQQKLNLKIMLIIAIALLAILSVFMIPMTFARESTYAANGEVIEKSSLSAKLVADKRNYIGQARISTYIHLKPSGDGMFMIEGRIDPKINDGSHDYKVRWFTLDVFIQDHGQSMNSMSIQDNSSAKIVTEGSGSSLTIKNDGVSFNISNSTSITYDTSSVRSNYSILESLPGEKYISKSIYIEPIKFNKDTSYGFTSIFFFKFNTDTYNFFSYMVHMKELRVDGIMFAPDYGTNNKDRLEIYGSSSLSGGGTCSGQIGKYSNDGSPNDWLEDEIFDFKAV